MFGEAVGIDAGEAVRQLRLCTEIEPDRGAPAGDLARLLFREQLAGTMKAASEPEVAIAKEAVALALRAAKNEPDHRHFDTLASLYLCLGDFAAAAAAEEHAVEDEPENVGYLHRRATLYALAGDGDAFAKTLGRALLLFRRREAEAKESKPKGEADPESTADADVDAWFLHTVETCKVWEKRAEAAKAVKAWYARKVPQSEEDWLQFARTLIDVGDPAGAKEAAKKGKLAFPASEELGQIVDTPDAPGGSGDDHGM